MRIKTCETCKHFMASKVNRLGYGLYQNTCDVYETEASFYCNKWENKMKNKYTLGDLIIIGIVCLIIGFLPTFLYLGDTIGAEQAKNKVLEAEIYGLFTEYEGCSDSWLKDR